MIETLRRDLLDELTESSEQARLLASQSQRIAALEDRNRELASQLAPLLCLDAIHTAQLSRR
jgi:hypothetical protein